MNLNISICALLMGICSFTDGTFIIQDEYKTVNSDDSDFISILNGDQYEYWECIYSPTSYEKSRSTQRVVAQVGNKKFSKYIKNVFCSTGFFTACGPGFCSYYIVAVKKDKTITIINNKIAFQDFIGEIDNIAEAKLTIRNNGYFLPPSGQYSAQYKLYTHGYTFNLFDFGLQTHLPDSTFKPKRIFVSVDRLGKVTRL